MDQLKPEHRVFIREMATGSHTVTAYQKAFPRCQSDKAAKQNAYRLMKNADITDAIQQERQRLNALAQQAAVAKIAETTFTDVLTLTEKRNLLKQIALGDIEIDTKRPMWDPIGRKFVAVPVKAIPNFSDRMRAIEMDNRMSGDNAPDKHQMIGPDGKPVNPLPNVSLDLTKLPVEVLDLLLELTQPAPITAPSHLLSDSSTSADRPADNDSPAPNLPF